MPPARETSTVRLRVRRGFVWYPRRCVDCGRLHLNAKRVALPLCVPCAR